MLKPDIVPLFLFEEWACDWRHSPENNIDASHAMLVAPAAKPRISTTKSSSIMVKPAHLGCARAVLELVLNQNSLLRIIS